MSWFAETVLFDFSCPDIVIKCPFLLSDVSQSGQFIMYSTCVGPVFNSDIVWPQEAMTVNQSVKVHTLLVWK